MPKYNAILPTLRDGDIVDFQVDQNGRLITIADSGGVINGEVGAVNSTYMLASSIEGDNATLIHSGQCTLFQISCYNTGPAGLRLGLFDLGRMPVPADEPKWVVYLPGQSTVSEDWNNGLLMVHGLSFEIMPEIPGQSVAGVVQSLNVGYRS